MNKLILIGNVGQDPSMRYTPSGQAVTSFSVASSRKYTTGAGERKEETTWFNCQAWGRLAEVTNEHLKKGQQVFLEGRVSLRTYDKRDGSQGASLDVNVTNVQFLRQRDGQSSQVEDSRFIGDATPPDDVDDGDLPF